MEVDLTITVSVILGVSAIISPVIVAIINNHNNLKLRKIEINKQKRFQVYEMYFTAIQRFLDDSDNNKKRNEYRKNLNIALMYAPLSPQKQLIKIDSLLCNRNKDDIQKELIVLAKKLAWDIT